jgi:hypothetical protein
LTILYKISEDDKDNASLEEKLKKDEKEAEQISREFVDIRDRAEVLGSQSEDAFHGVGAPGWGVIAVFQDTAMIRLASLGSIFAHVSVQFMHVCPVNLNYILF